MKKTAIIEDNFKNEDDPIMWMEYKGANHYTSCFDLFYIGNTFIFMAGKIPFSVKLLTAMFASKFFHSL